MDMNVQTDPDDSAVPRPHGPLAPRDVTKPRNDGYGSSVIVPALNAAGTIATQLQALAAQRPDCPWEVIVVDNGSTDETIQIAHGFDRMLPLTVLLCGTKGTSAARNAGAASAKYSRLLFCDADDEVSPDWVATMMRALDAADAVGGAIESERLNPARPEHLPRHPDYLPVSGGFLPRAISANLAVRRSAFKQIGGFPEPYQYASDDVAFCWRLQLAGFRLAYAPDAIVHYRYRETVRSVATKAYRLGRSRPQLFREYRGQGMPGQHPLGFLRRWLTVGLTICAVPFSARARWWWIENAPATFGSLVGSYRYRVWYP